LAERRGGQHVTVELVRPTRHGGEALPPSAAYNVHAAEGGDALLLVDGRAAAQHDREVIRDVVGELTERSIALSLWQQSGLGRCEERDGIEELLAVFLEVVKTDHVVEAAAPEVARKLDLLRELVLLFDARAIHQSKRSGPGHVDRRGRNAPAEVDPPSAFML